LESAYISLILLVKSRSQTVDLGSVLQTPRKLRLDPGCHENRCQRYTRGRAFPFRVYFSCSIFWNN
jgi:hypothetical protein